MKKNSVKTPCVYVIWYAPVNAVKIGVSTDGPSRIDAICQQMPPGHREVLFILPNRGRITEQKLHRYFSDYRLRGEWFKPQEALREWLVRRLDGPHMTVDLVTLTINSAKDRSGVLTAEQRTHTTTAEFRGRCRDLFVELLQKLRPGDPGFEDTVAVFAKALKTPNVTIIYEKKDKNAAA